MKIEIKVPFSTPLSEVKKIALKKAGVKSSSFFAILRKSIDARKANTDTIYNNYLIALSPEDYPNCYEPKKAKRLPDNPPIVVGFGPSGMFAALILAEAGLRPIVYEQGENADERQLTVNNFWGKRIFDSDTNVQFGEGGAGLFSDGKLMTQVDGEFNTYVLKTLVKYGANEECLYYKHAHIGSDKLIGIVKKIRAVIIALGGRVYFKSKVENIGFCNDFATFSVNGVPYKTQHLILAVGHSARESYEELKRIVTMEPKSFAVGMRIEHLQQEINKARYGREYGNPLLPPAEYKLTARVKDRGCYSFCMCPGGKVVASNSEPYSVVTNGMSFSMRDGVNANSAIVAEVRKEDFGNSVEGAISFQRYLERKAFALGGEDYGAPIQRLEDFLKGKSSSAVGAIVPSYSPSYKMARLDSVLPGFVVDTIKQAVPMFDQTLRGFNTPDAILTGFETRTSAPVRILRDKLTFASVDTPYIYPIGEGCGYSGGIVTSAMDGVKVANKIVESFGE